MPDSSITVLDGSGASVPIDGQTVGTDLQQTITIGDGANAGRVAKIDTDGSLQVETNRASNVNVTSVTSVATSTTILAANPNRRGAIIFNDSTAVLYMRYGATAASTTAFSVKIAAGASWVVDVPTWEGAVTGIWAAANGAARVTDISA